MEKWYGLFATVLTFATAAYILWQSTIDTRRSLSMHVADRRWSYILFGIVSTVSAGLLYMFVTSWFIPTLQLPFMFALLLFIAMACQLVAAWVPHTTGTPALIHTLMAYVMAILMMPLLAFLPFSPAVPAVTGVIIWLLDLAMLVAFISMFVTEHTKKYFLVYQTGYVAFFFIGLLLATFTAQPPVLPDASEQGIIPMSMDDFNDDPRLQNAIQNQLQQPTQNPVGPASTGDGQLLQPGGQ